MLTHTEQEAVERARQLLERTHYEAGDEIPERVHAARAVATGLVEIAATLEEERSVREAIQARAEQQQAILARHVAEAMT